MSGLNVARSLAVAGGTDPAARLVALFDAHYNRLYRLARRLTGNTDDALDLVQETFLKAARSPESIPAGLMNEEAWLVRVLINTRRDDWRKTSIRNRFDRFARMASTTQNLEASLIAKDTVWRALDVLSPRRRAIVVMHELEGLSIPVIASLLGISAITTRWHLSRGKSDLLQMFKTRTGETNEKP